MAKPVEPIPPVNKTFILHLDVRNHPCNGAGSAEMAIAQTQGKGEFIFQRNC